MDKKMVRKFFTGQVTKAVVDQAAGIYEATITTIDLDRQGEIVVPTGMKADNYMANPVVLWAHDYSMPPVAKALSLKVTPTGVVSQFQFPPRGQSPRADEIHDLWDGGYINTVSIGLLVLAMDENAAVPTITSWELLEYSLVPVPANANALRRGLDLVNVQEKEGRVLSAHNLELVKNAIDALTALVDAAETDKSMTPAGAGEDGQDPDVAAKAAKDTDTVTVDPWLTVFSN